jgi:hypothetical protein
MWRQVAFGLRSLFHRSRRDQDVADEVEQYFEEATADWRSRGLSPEHAKRAARLESGSLTRVQEQVRSYGWENAITSFVGDLCFTLRQLWKHPVFAATAILTLALGIGANTAIFTVVQSILLAPLPYEEFVLASFIFWLALAISAGAKRSLFVLISQLPAGNKTSCVHARLT